MLAEELGLEQLVGMLFGFLQQKAKNSAGYCDVLPQKLFIHCHISKQRGAGAPRFLNHRDITVGDTRHRIDQFAHRTTRAGAEIENQRIRRRQQMLQRQNMSGGEIVNMI